MIPRVFTLFDKKILAIALLESRGSIGLENLCKAKLSYHPIRLLVKYDINNPRNNKNAVDKVLSPIKEFWFKVPVIIDRESAIVTGHTRLLAAQKLGVAEIPCIFCGVFQ